MFNPGWQVAIATAIEDLKPGGHLAVVDFESTPLTWFRRWMVVNHVRMEGHLLPVLEGRFQTRLRRVAPAYGGCWRYFRFVGEKKPGR
jgi:S-adenosylmethionine-diacylgycerolhomoserine-N-methlytransferase